MMMDVKRHSGRSAMPQLLVKIVGGKQIKQLIDPNRTEAAGRQNEDPSDAPTVMKTSAQKLELLSPSKNTESAIIHAALAQVPDRVCVTAPSGDRSHSYIHLRRPAANNTKTPPQSHTEQEVRHVHPEDWLLLLVSEELEGWKLQTLEKLEEDVAALDPSHTGSVHQSELTYLFLRWQVPLRLPTLASLLNVFCSSAHPEQVMYEKLLRFIQKRTEHQELQTTEIHVMSEPSASGRPLFRSGTDVKSSGNSGPVAGRLQRSSNGICRHTVDIWKASPELGNGSDVGSLWSEGVLMSVDPGETETWLQRFQKMESALRLCDSRNTGYIEKEQARRLIQNYSQIFDLNLSPLKINEVMRIAQLHGRVHLVTALQLLKDR